MRTDSIIRRQSVVHPVSPDHQCHSESFQSELFESEFEQAQTKCERATSPIPGSISPVLSRVNGHGGRLSSDQFKSSWRRRSGDKKKSTCEFDLSAAGDSDTPRKILPTSLLTSSATAPGDLSLQRQDEDSKPVVLVLRRSHSFRVCRDQSLGSAGHRNGPDRDKFRPTLECQNKVLLSLRHESFDQDVSGDVYSFVLFVVYLVRLLAW